MENKDKKEEERSNFAAVKTSRQYFHQALERKEMTISEQPHGPSIS